MIVRSWIAIACMIVASTQLALAQSARWYEPYQRGVKAFEARNYSTAVKELEQAVAAESRQTSNKYVEGVFRTDYFPYYYLAVAYLELKQYDKAQANFVKARDGLSGDFVKRLTTFETRLANETAPLRAGGRGTEPAPPPPPPPVNPAFGTALRQADAALAAKRYRDALLGFDTAKSADAAEYGKQNIQARRDETARAFAAQLSDEGRQSLEGGRLNQAKTSFQQAEQVLPGQKAAQDGLVEIKRREDDFQRLKAASESDATARNFAAARDKLEQARRAHPEQFASENLGARLTSYAQAGAQAPPLKPSDVGKPAVEGRKLFEQALGLASKGKYAEAQAGYEAALQTDPQNQDARRALDTSRRFGKLVGEGLQLEKRRNPELAKERLVEARSLDVKRFEGERLPSVLDRVTKAIDQLAKPADPPPSGLERQNVLRQGLLALFKEGNAGKSIAILEPSVAQASGQDTASLHAYLAVAYATRALSVAGAEEQTEFREKAVKEFRAARSLEPNYQLSTRLVSPKILDLFKESGR